jgi:serine palmitoyltransferase
MSKLGFITYGVDDSPIVPLLLCYPGKVAQFSRMMRQMETPVFVVVVGYPATTLATARARLCISASHTKEDIDKILTYCDLVGDLLDLKYGSGERWPLQRILDNAVELVNA